MGYALPAQKKLLLTSLINGCQRNMDLAMSNQLACATRKGSMQQHQSAIQSSQASQKTEFYEQLRNCTDSGERESIRDDIEALENDFQQELDEINRDINQISLTENIYEQDVKRYETELTAYKQQLESIQQAEGKAIENATPKFGGLT